MKHIEFENQLDDLIKEIFTSKEEIEEAIKYFDDGTTIRSLLQKHLEDLLGE